MRLAKPQNPNLNYPLKSILWIFLIIIFGSFMVYGINNQASRSFFFLLVIVYYFYSKDVVLSIAIFFILSLHPWGLFYYKPHDWIVPLTSTVGISYKSFFAFAIIAKFFYYVSRRRFNINNEIKPYFIIIAIYIVFLIFWGIMYGHNAVSLFRTTLGLPVFYLFIIIPVAFNSNNIHKFNQILILFSVLHIFFSLFDIYSNGLVTNFLFYGRKVSTAAIWSDGLIRITGGIGIAFYTFIISLYYLASKKAIFSQWTLWFVVILSWFYILNSATRGWMISSFIIMITYLLFYGHKVLINSRTLMAAFFIVILGLFLMPSSIKRNVSLAFERLTTVEAVAEGDLTAGGTARRWDERGPAVLTRLDESPVFGFGYSKVSNEYYDGHVGNHSVLLMGGYLGLAVVWLTILSLVFFSYRLERKNQIFKGAFTFGLALVGIMIIHSTSRVMVSFRMPIDSVFIISFFLNHINLMIQEYKNDVYIHRNLL